MGLGDHLAEKSDPCTMPPPATCWGGSPCFSSQAPAPIKTFLQTLPPLENRRAFVFVTSGGAPGRVLYDLARLLQDKGAEVVDGFLAREELHHPAPCLIGRIPSCPNVDDLVRARRFAIAVAEHVLTGHHGLWLQAVRMYSGPDGDSTAWWLCSAQTAFCAGYCQSPNSTRRAAVSVSGVSTNAPCTTSPYSLTRSWATSAFGAIAA